MPTLLMDPKLIARLDVDDSFLGRESWDVVPLERDWEEQIERLQPDLVALVEEPGGSHGLSVAKALREREFEGLQRRILCVMDELSYRREADFLLSQGIASVVGDLDSETLVATVTQLLNVPTRVNVRARVVIDLQGRREGNELFRGRILDISTGGFLFESEHPFDVRDVIYCFFSLGRDEPMIFASGRINRVGQDGGRLRRYGVEFQDIRIDDRRRIADFVFRTSRSLPYEVREATATAG